MSDDKSHTEPSPKPTMAGAFDDLMAVFGFYPVKVGTETPPTAEPQDETEPKHGILEFAEEFERAKAILIDAVAKNQGDGYDPDCD